MKFRVHLDSLLRILKKYIYVLKVNTTEGRDCIREMSCRLKPWLWQGCHVAPCLAFAVDTVFCPITQQETCCGKYASKQAKLVLKQGLGRVVLSRASSWVGGQPPDRISEKLPKQVSSNAAKQTEAEESESAPKEGSKLTNCQQIEIWRKIYRIEEWEKCIRRKGKF